MGAGAPATHWEVIANMAREEWKRLQVNNEWKQVDPARKSAMDAESAITFTYTDLYKKLNDGEGRAGVSEWEHEHVVGTLNHFQVAAILGKGFSHSGEAFIDYMNTVVPPRDLFCVRG